MRDYHEASAKIHSDIMAISRLRMGTDGAGVSTLVAFYGCPLSCKYCINDECHGGRENIPRGNFSPKQLIKVLQKDEIYYLMSGGGIVFGGGEPLLQADFIHRVCKMANPKWKIRIETSLNVPWENVERLIDDIDEWIIDIKDMNGEIYRLYTGLAIDLMRNNLLKLKERIPSKRLHIRVPHIPHFNTDADVTFSTNWIRNHIGVEPEAFAYTATKSVPTQTPVKDKLMGIVIEIPDFLKNEHKQND